MSFFRRKSLEEVKEVGATSGLQKTLTALDLVMLGLGGIVGVGVFVFTGQVAANYSGPAVTLSYTIAGSICIFIALVYAEMATILPTSGTVYSYSYVAYGEVFAWLVGSVLILELTFGASTVAAGWSSYVQGILASGGVYLPENYSKIPAHGGYVNLPAMLIVGFICTILYLGTKDSKKLNSILVFIKFAALFAFVAAAVPNWEAEYFTEFMPFEFFTTLKGSAILFFAFTGFGTLATASEECKNPKRDLTLGIVGSLVLATLTYVIVSAALMGLAHYSKLDTNDSLALALKLNNSSIGSAVVATGAIASMTTVMLMQIYGQSRIFYVIARDGLLPKSFSKLHPKYDSPYVTLTIFGSIIALMAGFFPLNLLGQLSAMGALIDYITVSSIVMVFRFTKPDIERPFKCPLIFIVGPVAFCSSVFMLYTNMVKSDYSLDSSGKFIITWFIVMFFLYVIRRSYLLNSSGANKTAAEA
jgi:APA family basic amino acid/polyamine antiporter